MLSEGRNGSSAKPQHARRQSVNGLICVWGVGPRVKNVAEGEKAGMENLFWMR